MFQHSTDSTGCYFGHLQLYKTNREKFNLFFSATLTSITSYFGVKNVVIPDHWSSHVQKIRENITSSLDCSGICRLELWDYYSYDSTSKKCYLADIEEATANTDLTITAEETVNRNIGIFSHEHKVL
jgi:hypothetical protein